MFGFKRKKKRTAMDELQDKRLEASKHKLESADRGLEVLESLLINRRLEDMGPLGMERRKA